MSRLVRGESILALGLIGCVGDSVALTFSRSFGDFSSAPWEGGLASRLILVELFLGSDGRWSRGAASVSFAPVDCCFGCCFDASSMRILRTLIASLPKLKKEKKYY